MFSFDVLFHCICDDSVKRRVLYFTNCFAKIMNICCQYVGTQFLMCSELSTRWRHCIVILGGVLLLGQRDVYKLNIQNVNQI